MTTDSTQFYNIPTGSLLHAYAPDGIEGMTKEEQDMIYDNAAFDLVERVRSGEIWFPYQRYFQSAPEVLFENLKTINLQATIGPYRLHSYYPIYGTYMPPKFRGVPIVISGNRATYDAADVLSDHFIEDIRLKAKRYDQVRSIAECWTIDECLKEIMKIALHKSMITPRTLRDSLYEFTPENKIFNPTWARAILRLVMGEPGIPCPSGRRSNFDRTRSGSERDCALQAGSLAGKKWLDISSGWGDRLLTAMSLDMDYTGFDPNIELKNGHNGMINMFGDPKRHQVIYEPFEKATIQGGPYDVAFTSPPYFNLEDYAPGQKGQSIVSYPEFKQWMVYFLFASLSKAWDNLKEGGYLIIHLGDAKTIKTAEATNIFIESMLSGSSWEGVIGLQGEAAFPRPVWVWKKVGRIDHRNIWEPQVTTEHMRKQADQKNPLPYVQRSLYNMYPELHEELIRYYAVKYAPNYSIRRDNAVAVRHHVSVALPNISRENIDKILSDDLMISSLLETQGAEGTISWATAMIQLSFTH